MPTPEAIIFDLDGVIIETDEYHYRSWQRLADEEGIPFDRAANDDLRGLTRRASLLKLLKGRVISEDQMQAWMERKNAYYLDYMGRFTPADLQPGVGEFLRAAKAKGLKIGLASASQNARPILHLLQINDLFDAVGDAFSVPNPKPASDLFIWVAGRLNVNPARVIVVEDSEAGIEAALRAGMLTIGLGSGERLAKAHLVYARLSAACLEEALNHLTRVQSS
ncbi:MAG: beta-phosphoglucomutase [Anaerolinea sp.]|nr:beta-phosphoglucomutase [Anaerolinea sp.]